MYTIVGLGNPGVEYENSRHNTGRMLVEYFAKKQGFEVWNEDKKHKAFVSEGKVGPLDSARGKQEKTILLLPETFMNKSGFSVKSFITSKKKAEQLVVIYDDLDLPLGKLKISFGRGSGGHKGIESVARSIKTKDFIRVRVGITPTTPSGKLKKPKGDKKVHNFIIGTFKKAELEVLKKVSKKVCDVLETIVIDGRQRAMNEFN